MNARLRARSICAASQAIERHVLALPTMGGTNFEDGVKMATELLEGFSPAVRFF